MEARQLSFHRDGLWRRRSVILMPQASIGMNSKLVMFTDLGKFNIDEGFHCLGLLEVSCLLMLSWKQSFRCCVQC